MEISDETRLMQKEGKGWRCGGHGATDIRRMLEFEINDLGNAHVFTDTCKALNLDIPSCDVTPYTVEGDVYYNGGGDFESTTGIYFTPDKELAESFAEGSSAFRGELHGKFDPSKKSTTLTSAHLQFNNPKKLLHEGKEITPQEIENYKQLGHDSVINYANGEIREIIVFDKLQIKPIVEPADDTTFTEEFEVFALDQAIIEKYGDSSAIWLGTKENVTKIYCGQEDAPTKFPVKKCAIPISDLSIEGTLFLIPEDC